MAIVISGGAWKSARNHAKIFIITSCVCIMKGLRDKKHMY